MALIELPRRMLVADRYVTRNGTFEPYHVRSS
jgi:hypothetical protein